MKKIITDSFSGGLITSCSEIKILGWSGPLIEILNFCFNKGLLTESMLLAIISLLYKKGDIELLKNWRPISLLNVDNKIGSKVLANRLQLILPSVLNNDQTCSVPGRSIFENLMLARDSIDYCQEKKLPLALIKIDQEKADKGGQGI